MATLAPYDAGRVHASATAAVETEQRRRFWGEDLPERATAPVRRTMAAHLSAALADEMLRRPEILVFGEDVGRKGGVYYVTAGLQKRFGVARVMDTHLDETSILGAAQGAGLAGLLPIPEIQYLAYVHNAVDQLRGTDRGRRGARQEVAQGWHWHKLRTSSEPCSRSPVLASTMR
jgi:2-oxoisovalerate dehydrogenase E1 component